MMIRPFLITLSLISGSLTSFAQFSPQAWQPGSEAVAADDPRIQYWASGCVSERGWKDIADTGLGKPNIGSDSSVTGPADLDVLSLGDGGQAILTFPHPITNGKGPDFAIFENGFLHPTDSTLAFLELAFVEVSSDGINFVRFPASSLTQDTAQVDGFGWLDATKIHNLAGKYIQGFGTPFDLEDLKDEPGLDINRVTHIRIIDVIGSLEEDRASYDKDGNKINDPYPTPFPSGGFDLNAVAVFNSSHTSITFAEAARPFKIYPNPTPGTIYLENKDGGPAAYSITALDGSVLLRGNFKNKTSLSLQEFPRGIYLLRWHNGTNSASTKIIKY